MTRRSPFAAIARENARLDREEEREVMSRPPHLRHLSLAEYGAWQAFEAFKAGRERERLEADERRRREEERRRDEHQRELRARLPLELAELSDDAMLLLRVLRTMGGTAFVDEARVGFQALGGPPERFDAAVGELAGPAVVSVGPFIDESARPAARGVLTLRTDVEVEPPPEDRR